MKKIYLLTLILLAAVTGWSQTTRTWFPTGSGSWATANNWRDPSNNPGTPNTGDIIVINTGTTLTISNVPTITLNKLTITNNSNVTFTGGAGTQTLTLGGATGFDFVIANGATLTQASSLENIVLANAGTADISGRLTVGGTYNHNNTGVSTTVSATGVLENQNVISNTSTAKLVFSGGRYIHARNGGAVPAAAWNTGSTAEFAGVTNSMPTGIAQSFKNFVWDNANQSAGLSFAGSLSTIDGDFTIKNTNGNTLTIKGTSNYTLNVNGNFTIGNGDDNARVVLNSQNNDFSLNVGGDMNFLNDAIVTFNTSGNSNSDVNIAVAGKVSISSGSNIVFTSDDGNAALDVEGNLEISGGAVDFSSAANIASGSSVARINLAGNFVMTGGTFITSGNSGNLVNGTVVFDKVGTQTFSTNNTGNITYTNFTVSNQSTTQLLSNLSLSRNNTNNYKGTFTVNNGGVLDFSTFTINAQGTTSTAVFNLNAGGKIITSNATGMSGSLSTNNMTSTLDGGADFEFRGAATGTFTTTTGGGNDVRNLIINNTGGQVTMNKNISANGALTLSNGYVTPGANTLLVGPTGTSTTTNGSYVNGQLRKQYNANGDFTFYVGKVSTGLRQIKLDVSTGTNTVFVAEYLRASGSTVTNGTVVGSGISRVSQCEYWTLNRASGNRGGKVTLMWDASSNCGATPYVTSLGTLRVARHDGTAWTNAGSINGADLGSTLTSGFITSDVVTNFSPFALATSNAAENPLPVLFADVKAYGKNNGVQVEWSNLTEREIVNYEVERSANGIDFYAVNTQQPKSNRDDKASYTFFDASPVNGANYYRVRVQEQSGKVIYSKILRVEMGSTKYSFSLYPNPVTGKQLTVSLNGVKQGKYNVQIIDAAGQRVFTTNLSNVGTGVTQMMELPANVKTGMYVMIISGDNYRETQQFIVR